MVKIIRSRHFSREGTIDVMEIPFDSVPTLAALVFVHGDELHNITATYPQSVEPDLPEALMDMVQRGFSVKPERLWERIHRAKGIILAFDNSGNLVGCTAIRRDQRPYREKIRQSFGVSVDNAYSLNWVRARDEFKVREFYELITTTALAILDTEHTVYTTATGSEGRPAYREALANVGFIVRDSVEGSPLGHLRLHLLQSEADQAAAQRTAVRHDVVASPDFDAVQEEACDPVAVAVGAGVGVAMDMAADAVTAEPADAVFDTEPLGSFDTVSTEQEQEREREQESGW